MELKMINMQTFYFTAISKIGLGYEDGENKSTLQETSVRLEISKNLDKKKYLQKDGIPTGEGIKPMTLAFIQGLIANVKVADKRGWWKEADHMRYIIDELNRAFVSVHNSDPKMEESYL